MSKHSLLEYCSSLWCCISRLTGFSLVFWDASCKIFEVFYATATLVDNSSLCLTIDSNFAFAFDVLIFLYFVEEDHYIITEHPLATLE